MPLRHRTGYNISIGHNRSMGYKIDVTVQSQADRKFHPFILG